MVKNTEQITISDKIIWTEDGAEFLFGEKGRLRLPYRTIMLGAAEVFENNEADVPTVQDIDISDNGKLIIGTAAGKIFKFDISETGNTAGELLAILSEHCPWAWIGAHPWLENGSAEAWESLTDYFRAFFPVRYRTY